MFRINLTFAWQFNVKRQFDISRHYDQRMRI